MNKNIAIGIVIIIIIVAGYLLLTSSTKKTENTLQEAEVLKQDNEQSVPQIVNKQASFAIFTNGTFRVFTASMYHNLSQDVYIDANNPNTVRVKKDGVTWNDFFSTLPFKLTHECLTTGTKETFCTNNNGALKFYLNGEGKEQFLNQVIQDGDKLLITYGNESEEAIKEQLSKIPNPAQKQN